MAFESFAAPFADVERLGCRDLLWGQRLILDLFEYLESGPAEEVESGGEKGEEAHAIGLTADSRIWRLTFERPFAARVRDESLKFLEPQTNQPLQLPSRYCFSNESPWLAELFPNALDPRLETLTPTHYVFDLLDDFVEIVADDNPTIQALANELAPSAP